MHGFLAEWKKYDRPAGYLRNWEMAWFGTHLLALWHSETKGTKHMISIARENQLKTRVFAYPPEVAEADKRNAVSTGARSASKAPVAPAAGAETGPPTPAAAPTRELDQDVDFVIDL